jgi:predicted CopG family antitoxin
MLRLAPPGAKQEVSPVPKNKEVFIPDPEDLRIWEEYMNAPPRPKPVIPRDQYRRRRKSKRKVQQIERNRVSPTLRGFRSIMVRRSTYEMLFEMKIFYKKSFTHIVHELVNIAYQKTYKQAEVLARIEANRIKNETSDPTQPRRRYNV